MTRRTKWTKTVYLVYLVYLVDLVYLVVGSISSVWSVRRAGRARLQGRLGVYSYKISAVYKANSLALSDHLQGEVLDTDVNQVSEADANARIEDFDPDQVTVGIKIDHNALFHFFALGHLSLFEVHIEGIRRLAVFYFHAQPPVLVAFIHGADNEKFVRVLFVRDFEISSADLFEDIDAPTLRLFTLIRVGKDRLNFSF